jgi:type IV pilus assembly protein PilO
MNLRDSAVQKRIFALLFAGLVGYFYFGTTLFPFCARVQKQAISRLQEQLAEKESKIQLARSKAGRLEVLQARLAEMQEEWAVLERLLPFDEDVPGFIDQVARMASQARVDIDLMEPGPVVASEGFNSRSIEMRVQGDYHQVGSFLSGIANAQRVIRTDGLNLKGLSETADRKNVEGGTKRGSVEASFKATLFMLEGSHAGS